MCQVIGVGCDDLQVGFIFVLVQVQPKLGCV